MVAPRSYARERGLLRVIVLVLACVAFAVAVLLAFGVIGAKAREAVDAIGWLGVGGFLLTAATLL
jgi:hypothetical protein